MAQHPPRTCPQCGLRLIRVVYGMPDDELRQRAQRGEVAIGGCVIPEVPVTRTCPQCDYAWPTQTVEPSWE